MLANIQRANFYICERNFSDYRCSRSRNPTFRKLAALLHYSPSWGLIVCKAYNTNACQMEDVGTCCSSYCSINHCCITLLQGVKEIPSITCSNYTVWATDLWCCFDVAHSGGIHVRMLNNLKWCHIMYRSCSLSIYCGDVLGGQATKNNPKLVVREICTFGCLCRCSCVLVWGCKEKWMYSTCLSMYIRLTKPNPESLVITWPGSSINHVLPCTRHFHQHIYTLNTRPCLNKSEGIDVCCRFRGTEIKKWQGTHSHVEIDTLTRNKHQAFLLNQDKLHCSGVITDSLLLLEEQREWAQITYTVWWWPMTV